MRRSAVRIRSQAPKALLDVKAPRTTLPRAMVEAVGQSVSSQGSGSGGRPRGQGLQRGGVARGMAATVESTLARSSSPFRGGMWLSGVRNLSRPPGLYPRPTLGESEHGYEPVPFCFGAARPHG
jgi:hypothetical protein